jgi:hypothetical protein
MIRKFQLFLLGAAFGAALLLAPSQASAANCNFSRKEKIAMVSWIVLIPGAVITGLACKHDLFTKKGKSAAMLPTEGRDFTQTRFVDRRRRNAI